MMIYFTVSLSVVLLMVAPAGGVENGEIILQYSCNPSGYITVQNPDPATYTFVHAHTQDQTTNCTVYTFASLILVTGCPVSRNISLYLINGSELPDVLTDAVQFFIIRCQQIPATGVMRWVTDESWVTNLMSTSLEPSVTPKIILNTQLEDIESGVERQTAIVGEPLLWEIDGPEGYTVLPLNCTVHPGAGDDELHLVMNGCSLDTYLLDHFEYLTAIKTNILVAELFAFRFASSSDIVISCDMLGCVNTSTACDFDLLDDPRINGGFSDNNSTCSEKRRKRHEFSDTAEHPTRGEYYARDDLEYRVQRSGDLYSDDSAAADNLQGRVRVKLTVYTPEELLELNLNGSQDSRRFSSLLTFCTVLVICLI